MTDFAAFKEMMLSYKRGMAMDLSADAGGLLDVKARGHAAHVSLVAAIAIDCRCKTLIRLLLFSCSPCAFTPMRCRTVRSGLTWT